MLKHNPIRAAILSALSFSIAPVAFAESDPLDAVFVTATRTAQTVDDTLASVTVITQEDIQRQQASNLQDLLQAKAGFQFVNNGGAGKVTSLFIRGAESDHTLVMIDGIKVNSATAGTPPIGLLPLEMIERIEIVRGPRTSLYGSDALGGVIQIFTKKGKANQAAQPSVSINAGSHDTKGITAGVNGGFEKGWYSLYLKSEQTDGYNACTGDSITFAGCATEEPDDDGYENRSATFNMGYQLGERSKLAMQYLRSQNDVESDGAAPFAPNSSELISQVYGLTLDTELNDRVDLSISAGHNDDRNRNFQSGIFFSRFDTSRNTYSVQSNIGINTDDVFTLGVDYLVDKINSTEYSAPSRDNKGLFAQYQGNIGLHHYNLGLRQDDNEQFGNKTTGNIAVGHDLGESLKLTASYGTAFKAPTFNELYFPFFGNTSLAPEESETGELGIRGKHSWGNWSALVFRTDVDNLIVYDANLFLANNIAKARIDGFEASLDTRLQGWDVATSLTLLDTEDKSAGASNGNKLARRPDSSFRLDLDRDFGKFSLGSSLIAESHRYDDTANSRRIGGYATADLRAGYQLNKDLTLQAKIGNVFDKEYETASFFPQDGRNYMLTLSYSPE